MDRDKFDKNSAEAVAVAALTFLAADEERLQRFLDVTGLRPETVRSAAGSARFLAAVLDHVMGDEPLLVAFAAAEGWPPERVARAHRVLSPTED